MARCAARQGTRGVVGGRSGWEAAGSAPRAPDSGADPGGGRPGGPPRNPQPSRRVGGWRGEKGWSGCRRPWRPRSPELTRDSPARPRPVPAGGAPGPGLSFRSQDGTCRVSVHTVAAGTAAGVPGRRGVGVRGRGWGFNESLARWRPVLPARSRPALPAPPRRAALAPRGLPSPPPPRPARVWGGRGQRHRDAPSRSTGEK